MGRINLDLEKRASHHGFKIQRLVEMKGLLPMNKFAQSCGLNPDNIYKILDNEVIENNTLAKMLTQIDFTLEQFEKFNPDEAVKAIFHNITNTATDNGKAAGIIEEINDYRDEKALKLVEQSMKDSKAEKKELRAQNKDIFNKYHELHTTVINVCNKTLELLEKVSDKL